MANAIIAGARHVDFGITLLSASNMATRTAREVHHDEEIVSDSRDVPHSFVVLMALDALLCSLLEVTATGAVTAIVVLAEAAAIFKQLYCSIAIYLMGNSNRFPRGRSAANELCISNYSAC